MKYKGFYWLRQTEDGSWIVLILKGASYIVGFQGELNECLEWIRQEEKKLEKEQKKE